MEHVRTATKLLHIMLDAKYKKAYLNKFVETQFQQLTQIQRNELPEIITEVRRFFRWNTCHLGKYPVDIKLKEDAETICLQTYPLLKLHEEMFKKEVEHLVLIGVLEVANDS